MTARMATQCRTKVLSFLSRTLANPSPFRTISTHPSLCQESQVVEATTTTVATTSPSALPPNPSTGSPLYQENWRNLTPQQGVFSLVPATTGFSAPSSPSLAKTQAYSQTLDVVKLMDVFAEWMTSQSWSDLKQLFEFWIRSLDGAGKPNRPDVHIYNHYLRANLMMGSSAGELLDLVAQMEEYKITPNTASYNLVLKAMCQAKETEAAEKLIDGMLQTGTASLPDDESYNLVTSLLFSENQVDSALKYLDLMLNSDFVLSMPVFSSCARACIDAGRLDTLASIVEKCKKMPQNKDLCPTWNLSNIIVDVALQAHHSKLACLGLEFLARWIGRGERAKPAVLLSADEGLIVSALGVAARTHNSALLNVSWAILDRALSREKRKPNPESYLGRIHAFASMGNLQRAFKIVNELESVYGGGFSDIEELFSPFTSLHPLVVACCKNGFSTLDTVYYELEKLSTLNPPTKSVAALNCVILGSANIWDLERAYETFESIQKTFGLAPDIHSYNALISAFGKHRKTDEALKVFEHFTSLGVKPNAMTYSLLVDAHLVNRDPKAALNVIDEMINAGFVPSKVTLRKVRRRCVRESDFDSNDLVQSLVRKFNYRMTGDNRREILFNIQYATNYA